MQEIKRRRGESFEAFVRRFNKRIQQSGVLLQFKKVRFNVKDKSKNLQRKSALVRKARTEERAYLEKTGRLKEEPKRGGRR
ncbi:MAG: hypothetical protein V1928_05075 [Parcubacteria group bacterium]